jgi:hypothetical protein
LVRGKLKEGGGKQKTHSFWRDPWIGGESLHKLFDRLYDLSVDKEKMVSNLIVEEEGVNKIKWRWRMKLFQWEEELLEVCNGMVLGVERKEVEEDKWLWGDDCYTVTNAYSYLIERHDDLPI